LRRLLLLLKQAELHDLEGQLDRMDATQAATGDSDDESRFQVRREYQCRERKSLLRQIENKLKDYESLLIAQSVMESFSTPQKRNVNSYRNWLNGQAELIHYEMNFLNDRKDLIALSNEEDYTVLENVADKVLGERLARRLLMDKDGLAQTDNPHVLLYSSTRIGIMARLFIMLLVAASLLLPIVLLDLVKSEPKIHILVTVLFTMGFGSALVLLTRARKHDIFAATAAYCAVLVVFLGNVH